jgi:hypothetical protein
MQSPNPVIRDSLTIQSIFSNTSIAQNPKYLQIAQIKPRKIDQTPKNRDRAPATARYVWKTTENCSVGELSETKLQPTRRFPGSAIWPIADKFQR